VVAQPSSAASVSTLWEHDDYGDMRQEILGSARFLAFLICSCPAHVPIIIDGARRDGEATG